MLEFLFRELKNLLQSRIFRVLHHTEDPEPEAIQASSGVERVIPGRLLIRVTLIGADHLNHDAFL